VNSGGQKAVAMVVWASCVGGRGRRRQRSSWWWSKANFSARKEFVDRDPGRDGGVAACDRQGQVGHERDVEDRDDPAGGGRSTALVRCAADDVQARGVQAVSVGQFSGARSGRPSRPSAGEETRGQRERPVCGGVARWMIRPSGRAHVPSTRPGRPRPRSGALLWCSRPRFSLLVTLTARVSAATFRGHTKGRMTISGDRRYPHILRGGGAARSPTLWGGLTVGRSSARCERRC